MFENKIVEDFNKNGAKTSIIDLLDDLEGCELYHKVGIACVKTLFNFSKRVIEEYGQIDCLINNACISRVVIISGCSKSQCWSTIYSH